MQVGQRAIIERNRPILIVDDDNAVAEVLEAVLGTIGVPSLRAHDIASGLALYEQHPKTLVLADYLLPDGTGLTLIEAIKDLDHGGVFALMTGISGLDVATHALDLGVAGYIEKPFDDVFSIAEHLNRLRESRPVLRPPPEAWLVGILGSAPAEVLAELEGGERTVHCVEDMDAFRANLVTLKKRHTHIGILWDPALNTNDYSPLTDIALNKNVTRMAYGAPIDLHMAISWINTGVRGYLPLPLESHMLKAKLAWLHHDNAQDL